MPTATEPPADGPAEGLDSAWSDIEPGFAGNGEAQFASHDGSACSAPIRLRSRCVSRRVHTISAVMSFGLFPPPQKGS